MCRMHNAIESMWGLEYAVCVFLNERAFILWICPSSSHDAHEMAPISPMCNFVFGKWFKSLSLSLCVCNYVRLHVCVRASACMWMCANLCEKSFHSHLPFLLCIWGLWRYVQIIHRLRTEKTLFLHSRKLCRRKKDVTTLKTSGAYHEIFFIHVQMR